MAMLRKKEKKAAVKLPRKSPKPAPKAAAKPKAEPKGEAKRPAAAAPGAALARQAPAGLEPHTKSFVREAEILDEKIGRQIERIQKDYVALGEMFLEMFKKWYHRALGYGRFEEYLKARYPDQGKTQIFQNMRIVKELTAGDNPEVAREDVREMPRDYA